MNEPQMYIRDGNKKGQTVKDRETGNTEKINL